MHFSVFDSRPIVDFPLWVCLFDAIVGKRMVNGLQTGLLSDNTSGPNHLSLRALFVLLMQKR